MEAGEAETEEEAVVVTENVQRLPCSVEKIIFPALDQSVKKVNYVVEVLEVSARSTFCVVFVQVWRTAEFCESRLICGKDCQ